MLPRNIGELLWLFLILFRHNFASGTSRLTKVSLAIPTNASLLTFDGIGAISGGGGTSKLLMNYPQKQRDEILDLLFKPKHVGALQIVKVEIGGDSQSTDSTEASHMHSRDDLNFNRGYEWWLMKEAKRRNSKIILYGLPWVFPGWLGEGTMSPYARNNSNILRYIIEWVRGAKEVHNLDINYIGIWNERTWTADYIKALRRGLDSAGFSSTRIVAADGSLDSIENFVVTDPDLAKAIDVLGYHYPGAKVTSNAIRSNKRLWCSEEYSAYNDLSGGGCWARVLTESFVDAGYTGFIAWNLITSYYDGLPYTRSSLMTANQPWSGWYDIASPLRITAHFTHFIEIGWHYLPYGYGSGHLSGGGSFVTLVSPSRKDLTIIVQTLDPHKAKCFYGMPSFNVSSQQLISIQLPKEFVSRQYLHVWESVFDFNGNGSKLFVKLPDIPIIHGKINRLVNSNTLITFSTVSTNTNNVLPTPPVSAAFPRYYSDDFENYTLSAEPFLITSQAGTLEVRKVSSRLGQVISQMVTQPPIDTCLPTRMPRPIALVGSVTWRDVILTIDMSIPNWQNATSGAFIGVRLSTGGCDSQKSKGIFLWLLIDKNEVVLSSDANMTSILEVVPYNLQRNDWYTLFLTTYQAPNSSIVEAKINNLVIIHMTLPTSVSSAGWVTFGAADFGVVFFDNIAVKVR